MLCIVFSITLVCPIKGPGYRINWFGSINIAVLLLIWHNEWQKRRCMSLAKVLLLIQMTWWLDLPLKHVIFSPLHCHPNVLMLWSIEGLVTARSIFHWSLTCYMVIDLEVEARSYIITFFKTSKWHAILRAKKLPSYGPIDLIIYYY